MEAAYHGVPVIGIPIFVDQDMNMKQVEKLGFGLPLEILELDEEKLYDTISMFFKNDRWTIFLSLLGWLVKNSRGSIHFLKF